MLFLARGRVANKAFAAYFGFPVADVLGKHARDLMGEEIFRDNESFVPQLEGSEDFDEDQTIEAIAHTDYDQPIATRRTTPLPPAAPLPRQGGVFRRFLGGFRE